MKIIVDIPKETYKRFIDDFTGTTDVLKAVRHGKPLPAEHGRLIDANSLIKAIEEKTKRLSNTDTINGLCGAVALIFDAPTIIEAEGSEEDEDRVHT